MDTGAQPPEQGGRRVVDVLVDAVADLGVHHIFGVDGANIEDLYDALFATERRVQGVVAKHEFAAATMADGYARTTGGLGVVAATSGGGAMNLVAGLAEAYTSRVPVLALIGQPPTTLEGTGAFQDSSGKAGSIHAVRLFTEVSRHCARVEQPNDLVGHLERAVAAARGGGPAVLLLPKDIQQATVDAAVTFRPPPRRSGHDRVGLTRIRDRLAAARRTGKIVLIAGDQVARDDARDPLRDLAAALDTTVGVAPDAKDVYPADQSGFCGVAGSMGHTELIEAVQHCALCLLIGTRMPATARTGLEAALGTVPVASVGAEPPYLPTTHAASLDLRHALAALADMLSPRHTSDAVVHGGPTPLQIPESAGPGMRYREAVEAVAAMLPAGSDIFADAGNTGAAVVHHLPVPRGGRFVVALGMGGMGYSFGAAIGSACAHQRRTFVIAGDGAFYMHGMEIHTAIEHHLPITFIVFNNNAHAMCVTREQLLYRDRYSFNRFRPSMLAEGIAAMFPTMPSHPARTLDQLFDALEAAAATSGPTLHRGRLRPRRDPPVRSLPGTRPRSRRNAVTTPLPALSDLPGRVIPGILRIETSDREATTPIILDMLRSVYPHEQVFGEYCTVNGYIAAPPREVYDYLADTRSLEEWTYSLRGFAPTEQPGLWSAHDRLGSDTTIYTRTAANPDAMTVDYHCAWDQGRHLWMIYLLRVVDAQTVFDKPGSVVLWTNCHHPFYDRNPYPDTAPPDRVPWVGDFWDMFAAGHRLELNNLTALCEYRARHGLPITPDWMR